MSDDQEARLRRQVSASRHDPSNSEAAQAWAVDEIDRLRARVAELEQQTPATEWGALWPDGSCKTYDSEVEARSGSIDYGGAAQWRRVGPWVPAPSVPSGEETP